MHARLAAGLEARNGDRLGRIAYHSSSDRNVQRALPAAAAAGRQSVASGAAAEAEGHFGRALDLWDSVADAAALCDTDHAGLLVETAVAAKLAGRLDRAIDLYLRAAVGWPEKTRGGRPMSGSSSASSIASPTATRTVLTPSPAPSA